MNVAIANCQRTKKINSRLLKQIVAALLAELKIEDAELGIHLVGAGEMARVNWQFLKHEGSTDVITFDHNETEELDAPPSRPKPNVGLAIGLAPHPGPLRKKWFPPLDPHPAFGHLLPSPREKGKRPREREVCHGELFICVDDAVAQAREFKTTWQSEVVRYVAHGVLHLLGHDDLQPNLRRKMKREENRLLRRLGTRFSLAQL